jgi:hypothetical protein
VDPDSDPDPEYWLKLRGMGSQRGQIKGVLPWLAHWACRAGTRDFCSALAAIVGPVQNILCLTVHYALFKLLQPPSKHHIVLRCISSVYCTPPARLAFKKMVPGTRDFCSALAAIVGPVQNILCLTVHYALFKLLCRHRPASWEDSRAGSPVS